MLFRKISILSLALMLMTASFNIDAYAKATKKPRATGGAIVSKVSANDLFLDDYTTDADGIAPLNYTTGGQGGKVVVEKITVGDGVSKNCIAMMDTVNNGESDYTGVNMTRSFDKQTSTFAIETRFKFVKLKTPNCSFIIKANQGKNEAFRICVWSSGGILSFVNENSFNIAGNDMLKSDVWYTLRMVVDPKENAVDIKVTSDVLKNFKGGASTVTKYDVNAGIATTMNMTYKKDFTGDGIDNLFFSTEKYEGTYYIDYLKVEKKADRLSSGSGPRPDPIKAPIVADPMPHPVDGAVNINYNDEYLYLPTKAEFVDNVLMVPANHGFNMLGMKYYFNGEKQSLTAEKEGLKIAMNVGKAEATINGNTKNMDASVMVIKGKVFVPLLFICEEAGKTVKWHNETQTAFITDKGAE